MDLTNWPDPNKHKHDEGRFVKSSINVRLDQCCGAAWSRHFSGGSGAGAVPEPIFSQSEPRADFLWQLQLRLIGKQKRKAFFL